MRLNADMMRPRAIGLSRCRYVIGQLCGAPRSNDQADFPVTAELRGETVTWATWRVRASLVGQEQGSTRSQFSKATGAMWSRVSKLVILESGARTKCQTPLGLFQGGGSGKPSAGRGDGKAVRKMMAHPKTPTACVKWPDRVWMVQPVIVAIPRWGEQGTWDVNQFGNGPLRWRQPERTRTG